MDKTSSKLDKWRDMLYNTITNNKELNNGEVLKLSQKLDKAIVEEKTIITLKEIEESFSLTVAKVLKNVTNFSNRYLEIIDLEAFDEGIIMIKLADRLHNMRTIEFMEPQRWKQKSKETIEIFSPIAAKFNNSKLKAELDNLALKYV